MHRSFTLCMLFLSFLITSGILGEPMQATAQNRAQEIQFIEAYALSDDREATLQQLVPGTEEYYYFHCLHYLTTDQLDKGEATLKTWTKRIGETERARIIRNRLAVLKYDDDPQLTLDFLRSELGISHGHSRQIPNTELELPTRLDPKLIDIEELLRRIPSNRYHKKITYEGLELLADVKLDKDQRRRLLKQLQEPDFPNLVSLVITDLKQRDSGGFGSLNIHKRLMLAQLDECAEKMPKLLLNDNFVNTYLVKLHPSNDVDWKVDREEHRTYLARLAKFTNKLAPKYNSLKACILFRQLELDRRVGKYDKRKFLAYLRLPRQIGYVKPELLKAVPSRDHIVNLGADYRQQTLLIPINNDESLVKDYMQHFLRDANDDSQFRDYVRSKFLEQQMAIAKILSGQGDKERWASLLSPSEYQNLVKRVDIDFVRSNLEFYNIDDEVELELYTKNVKNLIVKTYEINTRNYYRKFGAEIDTDISLDGLVPNYEQTFEYSDAPALRVKRKFKLDQIKGPGVFVVDFIGNGKSSRALIRKGRLSLIGNVTIAGHLFKVMNDSGAHIKDAQLTIGGRKFEADKDGDILVPFTSTPQLKSAIVENGNFSCLQEFKHLSESYLLNTAFLVDRESLLRSNEARVMIRSQLTVAGHPVPTKLLEDINLQITSVNLDGLETKKIIDDLKLTTNDEATCKFLVPPRLRSIHFKLTAKVKNVSQNNDVDLSASKSYEVNGIDTSDEIQDVHLVPHADGYSLEVLGKTGESRSRQGVVVKLKVRGFKDSVVVNLQSDQHGLIELGNLENVDSLKARLTGGSERSWNLRRDQQSYYSTIHALHGNVISVPALEEITKSSREDLSLFEVRRGRYTHDRFEKIKVANGLVTMKGLEPGDYRLRFKSINRLINIRVTQGKPFNQTLVGTGRQLENRGGSSVHINNLNAAKENLEIQLGNINPSTRVHVIGSRYMPRFGAYGQLSTVRDIEPSIYAPPIRRSVYMGGRKIGDEYKYILDRQYATKYPGNMLERPSLLLNPWELRTTNNRIENLSGGTAFGGAGAGGGDGGARGQAEQAPGTMTKDYANLDFLAHGSVFLANMRPDEKGSVSIDRKLLGDAQHIRVIVVDNISTVERVLNLPLEKRAIRDMRLVNAMDAEKHYSQTRQVDVLENGDTFTIEDILSSKFQHYDDLGDVFRLLNTVNSTLGEFEFVLGWPEYDQEKKLDLYSKYACHELNFFLLKKDREFFDEVVEKHLEHKRDKTFVDRWLLRDDVDEYAEPWKFARLNAFERILLAQRMEDRGSDIARNVNEWYMLSPTPRSAFGRYFDLSLINSKMDGDDDLVRFEDAKKALRKSTTRELETLDSVGAFVAPNKQPSDQPKNQVSAGLAMDFAEADEEIGLQQLGKKTAPGVYRRNSRGRDGVEIGDSIVVGGGSSREVFGGGRPITRTRMETRTRSLPDGSVQSYQVAVPYTENIMVYDDNEKFAEARDKQRALFRRLGATKEWVENNYWKLPPTARTIDQVKPNRFWRDYANHDDGPFISGHFAEANQTLSEMMFALAVIDLPFKGPEHQFVYDESKMKLTTAGPMIAMHQQVQPAVFDRKNTTILVSENFFQKNDRYRHENGVQFDKFLNDEFSAQTLYGAQVVITNPTSTPQQVDLLTQIPMGAVVASGSQATKNTAIDLAAFSTQRFEYFFYFPKSGEYTHFPAHVADDDKTLAVADNVVFKVTDTPAEVDKTSWAYVSQNGTNDDVIEFINKKNVLRLDLGKIAFRMKDKEFFTRTLDTLRERHVYDQALWGYSLKHNDKTAIRELLEHTDSFSSRLGIHFDSDLITLNPVERQQHFHSEYSPLINARSHKVGSRRTILNPEFHQQYHRLLDVLSNRHRLDDNDHLTVTYYMLLQDRIEEALAHFAKVSVNKIDAKMQYDYCDAFLDIYREKPDSAANKAQKWADYPVVHWRTRFQEILAQVEEIRGGDTETVDAKNSQQKQTELAANAPSFDFKVEAGKGNINFQNLSKITVNFYEMDIELLFSRKPFAQDELGGFSMIRPNLTKSFTLPKTDDGTFEFGLPDEIQNKNVLVEIVGGDQTKSQPYFANSLNVQLIESYGQIKVTAKDNGKSISKAYVKVYSRDYNGQVKFHKDGYTDLRGRFDYVSQSNNSIDGIEKYSILIMHPENGAVIRQAMPPME